MIKLPKLSTRFNRAEICNEGLRVLFRPAPKNAGESPETMIAYATALVRAGNGWDHFVGALERVLVEINPKHMDGCTGGEIFPFPTKRCLRCEIDRLLFWATEKRS